MATTRREFLRTAANLGSLTALSGIAFETRPLAASIDDAVATASPHSSNRSEGEIFADYILEAERFINSVRNSNPASENFNLYRQAFDTYEKAHEYAKQKSEGIGWENARKLTYESWRAVSLLHQARLVSGRTGINIMKRGEIIKLKDTLPIKASGRMDSPAYSYLRAIQNYEKIQEIYQEMEEKGKKFPSGELVLGLGTRSIIPSPSNVRDMMYRSFVGAITSDLPREQETQVLRKWASTIKNHYEKTGEEYSLDKLNLYIRDKLQPYLAGREFTAIK